MQTNIYKIYCAGPLFNPKEREEMAEIASELKRNGYKVFLPQQDGLEFSTIFPLLLERKFSFEEATKVLNKAIFSLDVFEVMTCDGLVLNMNGRVPDEGAMVEAGIAWAHQKTLVIFRNDVRSLLHGNCNPLVTGLTDFEFVEEYTKIPLAFDRKFAEKGQIETTEFSFNVAHESGRLISKYLSEKKQEEEIVTLLINLFEDVKCHSNKNCTAALSTL